MSNSLSVANTSALAALHKLIASEPSVADELAPISESEHFIARILQIAAARGLALDPQDLQAAARPDPLGLSRWNAPAIPGRAWPSPRWLPLQVFMTEGQVYVDWAHFGGVAPTTPFFEGAIRQALLRPFNRFCRYRMTLDDFVAGAAEDSLTPDGFIFHMSRCGSTLVTQMLAALPQAVAISEAAPIDSVLQLHMRSRGAHVRALRAMVAAYGRRSTDNERHFVLKLDCWHALALPLFREAFPSVPWAFMYRDPTEVLVSQMRERGTQLLPQMVSPALYGLDQADATGEDYCARALAAICTAAADGMALGGGLLVNYRELPEAVTMRMLPHFGITPNDGERALMRQASRMDAKSPALAFKDDRTGKRDEATEAVRHAADRHLAAIYKRLEALRGDVSAG